MSETLPSGKLLCRLFAKLLCFALSSNIQSDMLQRRVPQMQNPSYGLKICLYVATFEDYLKQLCCKTVAIHAKRRLSSRDHFFEPKELHILMVLNNTVYSMLFETEYCCLGSSLLHTGSMMV